MATTLNIRSKGFIRVSGDLIARTPIRVGSSRSEGDVDLPVLRDGRGRVLIPGTSFAGACRAWFVDNHPDAELVDHIFGGTDDELGASYVTFLDSGVDSLVEIRNGVGIDRRTGTAASRVLYSYEVLPRGARIPFCFEAELPITDSVVTDAIIERAVVALISALRNGDVRLGGAQTRGLGRVELVDARVSRHLFTDPISTIEALGDGRDASDLVKSSDHVERTGLHIDVTWAPHGNVMSADGGQGFGVDTLPLVGLIDKDHLTVVLPGASIKGVLRSRAEFIVRTVTGRHLASPIAESDIDHLGQMSRSPVITALFGEALESSSTDATKHRGRRGALAIDDCYGQVKITKDHWQAITAASTIEQVAKQVDSSVNRAGRIFDPIQHVVIDRWTAGAAEGLLYSVLEVRKPDWEPIRLSLDLARIEPTLRRPVLGLLMLLVRDLTKNRIRLGYGVNRGSGRVEVSGLRLAGTVAKAEFGSESDGLPDSSRVQPFLEALKVELSRGVDR